MTERQIGIRQGGAADGAAALALLPRLAGFALASQRQPEDLWRHDAEALQAHLAGSDPDCFLLVAEDSSVQPALLAGFAFVRMQPEPVSRKPSAHLEVIIVAAGFEGHGVGRRLMAAAESGAAERGAESMTLHVFNENRRAHGLYESLGYLSEIQRCIKWL